MTKEIVNVDRYNAKTGGGFLFEDSAVEHFNLIPEPKHTSEWDAYTRGNKTFGVAVKHVNNKNEFIFELSRQANLGVDGFYLLIGLYNDKKNKYSVDNIYLSKVRIEDWKKLIDMDIVKYLAKVERYLKHNHVDDNKWESFLSNVNKEWKKRTPNILRLRLRRFKDKTTGESTYRFQCAIRVSTFLDYFVSKQNIETKLVRSGESANLVIEDFMESNGLMRSSDNSEIIYSSEYVEHDKVTETEVIEDVKSGTRITRSKVTETTRAHKVNTQNRALTTEETLDYLKRQQRYFEQIAIRNNNMR